MGDGALAIVTAPAACLEHRAPAAPKGKPPKRITDYLHVSAADLDPMANSVGPDYRPLYRV
jgi:hypothetical protein